MQVTLTQAQVAWLAEKVAGGEFASLDVAAQTMIARAMILENAGGLGLDNLDWAHIMEETAEAAGAAGGKVVTLEEFQRRLEARRQPRPTIVDG